jgi:hypothetical protein
VPAARVTTPPAVLRPVLEAPAPGGVRPRLQRLVPPDAPPITALPGNLPAFLGAEDACAYNPLPPARYEQFFTAIEPPREGSASVAYGGAGVGGFRDAASLTHPLCDLYGITFVITRENVEAGPGLVDRTPPHTGGWRLLERTTALPRATFLRDVDVLPDAAERLAALSDRGRDVAHRVVLEDTSAPVPSPHDAGADPADVRIVEHADERVVVRIATAADGYLRLADPFDRGWSARIDGDATSIYVADHYLRAVWVPQGEHEIVFTYDAALAAAPPRIGLVTLLALAALWFGGRRRRE